MCVYVRTCVGVGVCKREQQWCFNVSLRPLQGQFRSTVRCLTCGYQSVVFEVFMYLTVPIPTRGTSCTLQVGHTQHTYTSGHKVQGVQYQCRVTYTYIHTLSDKLQCETSIDSVRWHLSLVLLVANFNRSLSRAHTGAHMSTGLHPPLHSAGAHVG